MGPASPASGSPRDDMDTENKKDKEDKEDKEEDSWQPVRSPRVAQVGRAVEIVAVSTRPIFPTLSLTRSQV